MSNELGFDFYPGDGLNQNNVIAPLDYSSFSTKVKTFHNIFYKKTPLYWKKGVMSLLGKYDIYVMTGEPYCISTWVFSFISKFLLRKKVIFWGHGWYGNESFSKKILKKLFYLNANRLLIYGDYATKLMIQEGYSSDRLFVIHNSLNYSVQLDVIKRIPANNPLSAHFSNNNPTIVFSGRLAGNKKLHMILEAISNLRQKDVFVNCVFLGDGSERTVLEKRSRDLGIENQIWFYGACYDELIIGTMYWYAALCVGPGNIGLTAIHSMTFGCPVATHDNFAHQRPEFEIIKPGVTGDFFVENDLSSLTQMIQKWVSISPAEREKVRSECREAVARDWTPDYQISVLRKAIAF